MMTTEARPSAVLDRPAEGIPLKAPPSAGLALTAGDAAGYADANLEHDSAGRLFVFLTNLTVLACMVGALVSTGALFIDGLWLDGEIWMPPAFVLAAVLQRGLAKGVGRFTRWGWMGAMAELGLAGLTTIPLNLDAGDWISAVFSIGINLLWMSYFWRRRADFGIDIDL
jgi:hypothetical protein